MRSQHHQKHIDNRTAWNNCPECRADNSRRFAVTSPFKYGFVREYLSWIKPRLEAIRSGITGGDTLNAQEWLRDFRRALNTRINSHIEGMNGRKHAPDYAKYHLSTYGNDHHFLNP